MALTLTRRGNVAETQSEKKADERTTEKERQKEKTSTQMDCKCKMFLYDFGQWLQLVAIF